MLRIKPITTKSTVNHYCILICARKHKHNICVENHKKTHISYIKFHCRSVLGIYINTIRVLIY